jgi:ribonuclease D
VALDTEFMGEGRYRTLLCLIQLAVPCETGERAPQVEVLLDPLAQGFDGSPLAPILADPDVQVVVHAGRQDVALIRRLLRTEVRNVFDTQVAAGFTGLGAQCSYDSLLSELLDVRLAKSASFTRWDIRPLSTEQLAYAGEDVVHLLELARELERRLETLGRLSWAREECAIVEASTDERDLTTVWARLPRIRGLSAPSQAIARELVEWREDTAAKQDRPVQSILGDAALVELAKRRPSSTRELEQVRGVAAGSLRRRSQELLAAVRRGGERPLEAIPGDRRPPVPEPEDAPLVALAEALVRGRAREAGLAYELLAARADLQAIVAAWRSGEQEADVRTLRGWRRELAGEQLLELLDGRLSLSARDGALRIGA